MPVENIDSAFSDREGGDSSGDSQPSQSVQDPPPPNQSQKADTLSSIVNQIPNQQTDVPSAIKPSSASPASSSLAPGAIAGIAVGCGLILIAAVLFVWFLVRRRKRRAQEKDSFDPLAAPTGPGYVSDKETHGRAAESPNEPYSDDGYSRDAGIIPSPHASVPVVVAAAPAVASRPTSYPETTHTHQSALPSEPTATSPIPEPAPAPAPAQGPTKPTIPSSVAHLVEDGMTEADIRRLEEEERALDRAIEQARER